MPLTTANIFLSSVCTIVLMDNQPPLLSFPAQTPQTRGTITVVHAPSRRPGALAVREGGGREPDCPLVVAFEDAFSLYDPCTGKRVAAAAAGEASDYEQLPNTRLNDGRCLMLVLLFLLFLFLLSLFVVFACCGRPFFVRAVQLSGVLQGKI